MKRTMYTLLLGSLLASLTACGGGGGGGSSDTSQYEPGTAAPTIAAPATVTAYPGGTNRFTVTVGDSDTVVTNLKLTGTVVSYTGLSEAPTLRTNVDVGAQYENRTVSLTIPERNVVGTVVLQFQISDGAHTAQAQVNVSIVPDPNALQAFDYASTYASGSVESEFYLSVFTEVRGAIGALRQDSTLDRAARAHAAYLAANGGISSTEMSGSSGFSGVTAADRAKYFGYAGVAVRDAAAIVPANVMASEAAMVAATKMANSVYRASALRNGARDVGIGTVVSNGVRIVVAIVGTKTNEQRQIGADAFAVWPQGYFVHYAMETDTPDAIPENNGACSGTPISIRVQSDQILTTASFTLQQLDTTTGVRVSVPAKLITSSSDANHQIEKNFAYLVPLKPLKLNTTYMAHFTGSSTASKSIDQSWVFDTKSPLYTHIDGATLYGCAPSI